MIRYQPTPQHNPKPQVNNHNQPSPQEYWKQKYHDAKVKYFQEFMKRLFFESKYINLCKLCEEYMTELCEALQNICVKQKIILNSTFNSDAQGYDDGNLPIIEENEEDDATESAKGQGISQKIARIQDRLGLIEDYDMMIVDKYKGDLRRLADEMKEMTTENESLRITLDSIKDQLRDMQTRRAETEPAMSTTNRPPYDKYKMPIEQNSTYSVTIGSPNHSRRHSHDTSTTRSPSAQKLRDSTSSITMPTKRNPGTPGSGKKMMIDQGVGTDFSPVKQQSSSVKQSPSRGNSIQGKSPSKSYSTGKIDASNSPMRSLRASPAKQTPSKHRKIASISSVAQANAETQVTNRDKSYYENEIKSQRKHYDELFERFQTLQNEFVGLQDYLRTAQLSTKEQLELEDTKKQLAESQKIRIELESKVLRLDKLNSELKGDLESKLTRLEKLIKDKEALIGEITKNLNNAEMDVSAYKKEKDLAISQKSASEARLKVVQGNLKSIEKEKERLQEQILQKEKAIAQIETENQSLKTNLQIEKDNATSKLDKINQNFVDFTKQNQTKDSEIEALKKARTEYQAECKDLVQQIFEKDKEIALLQSEKEEQEKKFVQLEQSFDNMYRKRIEENFTNVVSYIEEKESEVQGLRKALNEKESEQSFINISEGRRIKEMEAVMLNLARELRLKEEENEELKAFVEKYRDMLNELHNVPPNKSALQSRV